SETLARRGGIVLESYGSRVHLTTGARGQRLIELRTAGLDPADARAAIVQGRVEIGYNHIVADRPRLADDPAIAIDDHCIAGADFIVVPADAVGEHQEHSVVVGPRGKPPHQPTAALVSLEF